MTFEIAAVLAILAGSLVLFVTEKLRMDVVALLVLSVLAISGLVSPQAALAGFSNPAVVTVWAMFILSAGLSATGVADQIGARVTRLAGRKEPRMIIVIMLTTGLLSAVMNNIGVAALMLPVVMDIARRAEVSPSRLLMPMAYASLLGGLTTLVGTPPNLVASETLAQTGHPGFGFFSFTPIGLPALVTGTLFVAFLGRHLLPSRMPEEFRQASRDAEGEWQFSHDLEERRFRLRVAEGSPLEGRPLRDTGLGALLGLTVVEIERNQQPLGVTIDGDLILRPGDILHVQGRREEYEELFDWQAFEMAWGPEIAEVLSPHRLARVAAVVSEKSEIAGLTVREADFRRRFQAHILSIHRGDREIRSKLASARLVSGDELRLELRKEDLDALEASNCFDSITILQEENFDQFYPETDALLELAVPAESRLAGSTVAESGIWDALELRLIAIGRRPESLFLPEPEERILPGDQLLVHGTRDTIRRLEGIQSLELVDDEQPLSADPHPESAYTEVTLSPRSRLAGQTLRELDFRRRYGLQVLSIWRAGRAHRSHLRNFRLEFGDALLFAGPRDRIAALSDDSDFLVLSQAAYEDAAARKKASPFRSWLSAIIMLAVVLSVLVGWFPIAIAAVAGATLMIVTRCLNIETALRAIEWKSVFLIACMIPLGTAMKETGAAEWIAQGITRIAGPLGPWGLIIALYLVTMLATTIVPTAALVLIMAQIGIDASSSFGLKPEVVVMAVAMAASASFTSPISHPANVLVMGPGGYRFVDYIKLGIVLAIIVALTVIPMIAWLY